MDIQKDRQADVLEDVYLLGTYIVKDKVREPAKPAL